MINRKLIILIVLIVCFSSPLNSIHALTLNTQDFQTASVLTALNSALENLKNLLTKQVKAQTTGLVASYSFDEGSGITAADASGNGRTATLTNGPTWTMGKYGGAIQFDGVNDRVTVPDNAVLQLEQTITISAWIKPMSVNSDCCDEIVTRIPSTGDNRANYILRLRAGGKLMFTYRNSTDTTWDEYASDPFSWTDGWHHVAVSFTYGTGSSIKLYRDGVLLSGTWVGGTGNDQSYSFANGNLNIGNQNVGGAPEAIFKGLIDDVRIYNQALTQAEIQVDMNTPIGGITTPPPQPPSSGTNFFKWDAESLTSMVSSTGTNCRSLGYFGNTVLSTDTAHSGSRSMKTIVVGNDGGNQNRGIDIYCDSTLSNWPITYPFNVVGGGPVYYRTWMKFASGFKWGTPGVATVKTSRGIGKTYPRLYTGHMRSDGFYMSECETVAGYPGGGCLTTSGQPNNDFRIKIPYDIQGKADGQWHEYIWMLKPNSAPNVSDAVMTAWVDGVQVGTLTGWRLSDSPNPNTWIDAWGSWMGTVQYWQVNDPTNVAGGTVYVDDTSTDSVFNSIYGGVTPPPTPAPTVSLSANPTSITSGSASTLTWSSTNATSCTASGGWTGTKSTSGSQSVSPTTNTTYTLSCTGARGTATQSATVTVTSLPPPASGATQLFSENFESGNFASFEGGCSPANIIDTSIVHGGTHSLHFRGEGFDSTGGCSKYLPGIKTAYMQFYWYFPVGFDDVTPPIGGHHAFRFSNFANGNTLGGGQFDTFLDSGNLGISMLWKTDASGNGVDYYGQAPISARGRWIRFEVLFSLNTPGLSDGSFTFWVDGVKYGSRTGLNTKSDGTDLITHLMLTSNFNPPYSNPSARHDWYIDDVTVWNGCPSTGASCSSGTVSLTPPPTPTPTPTTATTAQTQSNQTEQTQTPRTPSLSNTVSAKLSQTSTSLTITKPLYLGVRDTQVSTLQTILINTKYLKATKPTNYYGPLTQQAVKKFQCDKGIVCSGTPSTTGWGNLGPKTRLVLLIEELKRQIEILKGR